jgi:MFS family permease
MEKIKPDTVGTDVETVLDLMPDEHSDPAYQNRNAIIYASLVSLTYLAAPVLYIGIQAGLCKRLHATNAMANLPSTVYAAMAWFPVIIAWLFPQARLLKKTMSLAYGLMAASGILLAVLLISRPSNNLIIWALVVQAALLGGSNGVLSILNWEALDRGVSARLRGKALGLAFGLGPAFAVIGSLFAQLLLNGKLFGHQPPQWLSLGDYPYNYAILFGTCGACSALAALLVHFYRIPLPKVDMEREPFHVAVLGGFKGMITNRTLLIACIAYLLVYCGNMVQNNMNIFTRISVGRAPEDLVGYQLALRFSFKMLAGFLLGWLLIRTNPKVPLLVTAGLQIVGVLWVLLVPGYWFMLAFGLMGAGELFGVYYINYPVCCSPKSQVRRNIAFLGLISSTVGFAPMLYGWISDTWSLRVSFFAALIIMIFATLLVFFKLPARPQPPVEDLQLADLGEASRP